MRFLTILSIALILSGTEPQHLINTRYRRSGELSINAGDGFETVDPRNRLTTVDVDKDLKATLEVFSILTNSTDESFADNFLKTGTGKLLSALKGVWIVASFASGHLGVPYAGTTNILIRISRNFKKLSNKVLCKPDIIYFAMNGSGSIQSLAEVGLNLTEEEKKRPDMKVKLDDVHFNTLVVVPVNSTSSAMMAYLNEDTSENQELFVKYYKEHGYIYVAQYIVSAAFDNVRNVIDASEFDTTKVDQMRSKFARYLFQTYIIGYFNEGLKGEKESLSSLARIFSLHMEEFTDSLKSASKYYDDIFFPIYLKRNLVKSELDGSRRNNCDLAQGIIDKLKSKCTRHKYVVIVSDEVSTPDQFAYYGYPERLVIKEEYNGKTVIAFMATTQNWKNEQTFYDYWYDRTIRLDVFDKYNANNLHTLMGFGKDRDDYQTAVFKDHYNPCLRSDSKHASHISKIDLSRELGEPGLDKLIYFVVY